MKRSREDNILSQPEDNINLNFLLQCKDNFNKNPSNVISRNAIVSIGSMLATTNSNQLNTIDHVFMNTLKKKHLKATNQGSSGRCWMYSALNIFRHSIIKALSLENFEFSETYLFFYDKLERSNSYLKWFIDHPNIRDTDKEFIHIVSDYTTDGGWWNTFSNLVKKYGLVPKSSMKETFQSNDSEDMNRIIDEKIQSCANYLRNNNDLSYENKIFIKNKVVEEIYFILVKFLGDPPNKFKWSYTTDEDESNIISELTPINFMEMVIPSINIDDFIVLSNIPGSLKYNTKYTVKYTNNVYEGNNFTFINIPINELIKYTTKSVLSGMPVWFASDVTQDFNPYHAALDDNIYQKELVFGENYEFSKKDRIIFKNLQANHAMTIIGLNVDNKGKPTNFQIENSWGFFDNQIPGLDGFLHMSHSWFIKNVMQVVIHKKFLSRSINKINNLNPIFLDPWDSVAPALKINPVNLSNKYQNNLSNKYQNNLSNKY